MFDSFSQNGEDVVLWRALQGIPFGRYIDVGANDPVIDSVSRAFYDRGWHGITVEPDPHFALLQREQRPRDIQVEAAITAEDGASITLHVVDGTGLSTVRDDLVRVHAGTGRQTHDVVVPTRRLDRILNDAGWAGKDIHFMSVDTEGSERAVLESIDLSVWRPWILIVEATVPTSTEESHSSWNALVTQSGYDYALFDGLSRWYVAKERVDRLSPAMGYAASVVDNYTTRELRQNIEHAKRIQTALDDVVDDIVRWRAQAITRWARTVADEAVEAHLRALYQTLQHEHGQLSEAHHELSQLCHSFSLRNADQNAQLSAIYQSTSWRITQPLRAAVGRLNRARRRQ